MEKEFDFKDIGKRMPYKVPDAYFKELEETITTRTDIRKPRKHRLWIIIHTLAAVAVLTGLLFLPTRWHSDREQMTNATYEVAAPAIEELSDEELEEIIGLSSIDVFLN